MGGTGREVHEEGLVRHQRLLLADPVDGMVGKVFGEVVALLRRSIGFYRRGPAVEGRRVLVRLAPDEAVEVFEATANAGPRVEGTHRARLPDRYFVAFAKLRGGVPVQLECFRQRRARIRANGAIARSRR